MKNLIKYTNKTGNIVLEDYFGDKHLGKVLVASQSPFSKRQRHYFFKREDGAMIPIYHKGSSRVMEKEENKLKLIFRSGGSHYTPQELTSSGICLFDSPEDLESFRFENMIIPKNQIKLEAVYNQK